MLILIFLILGPYTFTIGDTTGLSQYKRGGLWHQVKMPRIINFVRSTIFTTLNVDLPLTVVKLETSF